MTFPPNDYFPPVWGCQESDVPNYSNFSIDVIRKGVLQETIDIGTRPFWVIGGPSSVDNDALLRLSNPGISRKHCVLQFSKADGTLHIFDLESRNGTFINNHKVNSRQYMPVFVGDQLTFGDTNVRYVVNGPEELMREELDIKTCKELRRQELEAKEKAKGEEVNKLGFVPETSLSMEELGRAMTMKVGDEAFLNDEGEFEVSTLLKDPRNLTTKQEISAKKISTIEGQIRIQEKIINQLEAASKKATLSASQASKLENAHTKVQTLEEEKSRAITNLYKEMGWSTELTEQQKDDVYGTGLFDETDEFFDRTQAQEKVIKASVVERRKRNVMGEWTIIASDGEAHSIGSLESKIKDLESQEEKLKSELLELDIPVTEEEEEDPLDTFMRQNEVELNKQNIAKLKKEISQNVELRQSLLTDLEALQSRQFKDKEKQNKEAKTTFAAENSNEDTEMATDPKLEISTKRLEAAAELIERLTSESSRRQIAQQLGVAPLVPTGVEGLKEDPMNEVE
eukprot:GHVP01060921.1.p1 GENE.GHVP01060921.1~~GHVP01060921.1.p1  ORF type:complete len:512 (+),score=130.57 GHVP01060921.1:1017-2552(+)